MTSVAGSPSRPAVGVIGLGIIGSGMAWNLHKAGFPLTVYNRNPERSQPFAAAGVAVASSPAELAARSETVVVVVSDIPGQRAVLLGGPGLPPAALAGARPGTLFIDSCTVTPEASQEMAAEARARGCAYLDAPVVGSKDQARDGQLFYLVGGAEEDLRRAQAVFEATGRGFIHMGPIGSGSAIKLINNMMAASILEVLGEGLLLAERFGLDPAKVAEFLPRSAVGSYIVNGKLPKMQAGDYTTNFALELMQKDLRYFLAAAGKHDIPVPVAALLTELYRAAKRSGYGKQDMSAIYAYLRSQAGMA